MATKTVIKKKSTTPKASGRKGRQAGALTNAERMANIAGDQHEWVRARVIEGSIKSNHLNAIQKKWPFLEGKISALREKFPEQLKRKAGGGGGAGRKPLEWGEETTISVQGPNAKNKKSPFGVISLTPFWPEWQTKFPKDGASIRVTYDGDQHAVIITKA